MAKSQKFLDRCARIRKAVAFEAPDKVPYSANWWSWRFMDAGFTYEEATHDNEKVLAANQHVMDTYPLDGNDRVLEVVINTAGIPTSKGVQVGDPVSAVTDAYGKDCREVGMYYAYEDGAGKSLQFFIQNDAVQEISYYYDV